MDSIAFGVEFTLLMAMKNSQTESLVTLSQPILPYRVIVGENRRWLQYMQRLVLLYEKLCIELTNCYYLPLRAHHILYW